MGTHGLMEEYTDHPHPSVRVLAAKLRCGNCGSGPGRGLAILTIEHPAPYAYRIRVRCLLCGSIGAAGFETEDLEPGELEAAMVAKEPEGLVDAEIELHRMSDEDFAAGWAKLTGKS